MLVKNSGLMKSPFDQGLLTLASVATTQTYTDETALRSNLSSGYDRFVRPSSPTVVTIYYNIRALQDLDITEQEITLTGWMTLWWTDPRLAWDNSSNKIDQMEINWGWRPEFVISNSARGFTQLGADNDKTTMRAYLNGHVRWNALLLSTTSCDVDIAKLVDIAEYFDIAKFPFDTQTCALEVIFWNFRVEEVTLNSVFDQIRQDVYLENAEWIFDGSSIEQEYVPLCCPTTIGPLFRIHLTFSRRRPFYVMNLIFPTILLSACMVWAFMLPTESGERLGFALTILLAYTVQLSITAQLMPTTSKQVPHIAQYLLIVLVLCSAVTCNVVIHVKLFYLQDPVYGWIKAIYRKVQPVIFLACCSRHQKRTKDNSITDLRINRENTSVSFQKKDLTESGVLPEVNNKGDHVNADVTWADVSVCLDRLCFYLYVIAVGTVNGVFLNSIS